MSPGIFLDRDGTLIEFVHYLSDPNLVRLLPHAPQALRLWHDAGYACVVITNQAAVGKGIITPATLEEIHREMLRQIDLAGTTLDGIYYCPTPGRSNDQSKVEFEDRKPGPGMIHRACRELDLDVKRSWMVGDALSDVLAGYNAGCRGSILIRGGPESPAQSALPPGCRVVENVLEAANVILETDKATQTI